MEDIPHEVFIEITEKLDDDDLFNLCETSSSFKLKCQDNYLWKKRLKDHFPEKKKFIDDVYENPISLYTMIVKELSPVKRICPPPRDLLDAKIDLMVAKYRHDMMEDEEGDEDYHLMVEDDIMDFYEINDLVHKTEYREAADHMHYMDTDPRERIWGIVREYIPGEFLR